MPKFDYKEDVSAIFGKIKRHIIKISVYSEVGKTWLGIENVLADSGADVSILPREIGENLVEKMSAGKEVKLRGVVPYSFTLGFVHNLKIKINGKEFVAPVVLIDSDDVHPILVRRGALDESVVTFEKVAQTIIE